MELRGTRRHLPLVEGVIGLPAPMHRNLMELGTRAAELEVRAGADSAGPIALTIGYPVEGHPTNLFTLVDSVPEPAARRRVGGLRGSRLSPGDHRPRRAR